MVWKKTDKPPRLVKYRYISNVNQQDKNTNSQILLLLGHQPEQASDIQTCAKKNPAKTLQF